MDPFVIIIGVVLLIAVILLFAGLTSRPAGQGLVERRIGRRRKSEEEEQERTRGEIGVSAAVDRAVAGRGFAENLAIQIAQADLKWTVGEFLVLSLLLAIVLILVFYVIRRFVFIPLGIIAAFMGPRLYLGIRKSARLKAFDSQLSDALNLIVNSLRAGYSTAQALEVISNEMPSPISDEFGRVVLELQLGVPFDTAMSNLLRRMPSPDMDLVITAMSVQREVGGNLAEVLDAITFTIRERVRIKGEIKTLTAQGRITGYLITGLPFVLTGVIYMVNPGFMSGMFEDQCGWAMIGVALFLLVIGYFSVKKITAIEI
jgi:tight adherence protein B